jgi:general secretion pathway protein D
LSKRKWIAYPVALLFAATLVACAENRLAADGKRLIDDGRIEDGLTLLEMAARENPRDVEIRARLFRERDNAINRILGLAEQERAQGKLEYAEAAYRRALTIDANNLRAKAGLALLQSDSRLKQQTTDAEQLLKKGDVTAAEAKLRAVLSENPDWAEARDLMRRVLERNAAATAPKIAAATASKPITLEFRDAPIRSVFEMISRTAGINFVFDKDVRSDIKVTIFVRNSNIEDTVKLLLVTNQLERKVINENSVLIYPNTPAKLKDYQELVARSIYLGNADAKTTSAMIKAVAKIKDVYVDEKLNLLVIRDTPDAVRLAEQLIAAQDQAEPEVMLEVEVLEVKRTRMRELGVQFPNQLSILNIVPTPATTVATATGTVTTTSAVTTTSQLTLEGLRGGPGASQIGVSSNPLLNLKNESGNTTILANPRIRVKNRDKAKVHIGDRVPVITSTSSPNTGVAQSVNYLDVGLKLEVEPNVMPDDDVSIKVSLEVSNITREIAGANGTLSYQIGTRNAATSLRLRNGETQVLAGLINDEDRRSTNRLPGLGDLPLIGRLFGSDRSETNKTEIVLLITPRVVRNILRLERSASEFAGGTENAAGSVPLGIRPTRAGAIGLSSSNSTAGSAIAAAPVATESVIGIAASPVKAVVSGGQQALLGKEFAVTVNFPPATRSAEFDVVYDPALVTSLGLPNPAEPDPGRVRLRVDNPTGQNASLSAAFRVTAKVPAVAQLQLENITATGEGGAPLPVLAADAFAVTISP